MYGVKKEFGSSSRPHDAHDAGSCGTAGTLKSNKMLDLHAVGSVWGCKYQCW